ncbi:hypothetical protein ADIAL_2177 [Alkalibacterium sp. AK22]|nr:hypothetical protein ADIAL_2177 [Alkalibacterium sp. AK22]
MFPLGGNLRVTDLAKERTSKKKPARIIILAGFLYAIIT